MAAQGLGEGMRFLRAVREDEALRARVRAAADAGSLERVAAIAAEAGFAVDAEALRLAHRHDWALRLARYAR